MASLLFFFLPTQLAYFFWPDWSYLWGIRVDFLSPVIFLTDIIILLLGLFWLLRLIIYHSGWSWEKLFQWPITATVGLLVVNVLLAYQPLLAGYRLIKWFELVFLLVYFKKSFSPILLLPLFFSLLVVSFLAWGQFLFQESLQGIFWWLGERFFNTSSLGIAKMGLLGRLFVRPMATFSHPNSLAGFVLVSLAIFWQFRIFFKKRLGAIFYSKKVKTLGFKSKDGAIAIAAKYDKAGKNTTALGSCVFYLGLIIISTSLIITFSATVWSIVLAIGLFLLVKKLKGWWFWLVPAFGLAVFAWLINDFGLVESQSVLERWFLINNAWQLFIRRPILGWGLGNFIPAQGQLSFSRGSFNFYQPVHNLFLLMVVEAGVLGLVTLLFWFRKLWVKINNNWRGVILLIVFSGFFDHYWLTLQQNFLLLGLAIAISLRASEVKKERIS